MINLFSVILKNLKILIRSKFSALIILIAPLLIVLLVGMAFNSSSLYGVKVGTYSSSYNDLTESLLTGFEEQSFSVNKLDSEDACIESVKTGETQICVIFPPDLSMEGNSDSVKFHVDDSRVNIAYTLINDIDSKISTKSSELSIAMTQALIDVVDEAKNNVVSKKDEISTAISDTNTIKTKSKSLTTTLPDFNATMNKLNATLNLTSSLTGANQTIVEDIEDNIRNVMSDIGSLRALTESISVGAVDIQTKSDSIREKLDSIDSGLSSLNSKLENVKVTEAEKVVSPIKTDIEPLTSDSSNLTFLFPTLLALILLLASIILSSTIVLRERKTRAYFRNFMTPTSDFTFLLGTYITCLIILVIQLAILLAVAIFWLKMPLMPVLANTGLILFISATTFIFLGMAIGYSFKSEETSILASIGIAALLMFFSNTILPVETIADKFKYIAIYNPLVVTNSILKKMILFKSSLSSVLPEIYILLAALAVFFLLAFLAREITKRKVDRA